MKSSQNYQIRIEGLLDYSWSDWFDGLTINHMKDDTTVLTGVLPDQAALHGVLNKIRDLGLVLMTVAAEQSESRAQEQA